MRLMKDANGGRSTLTCVYCGAEAESKPPYPVVYCYCRGVAAEAAPPAERLRRAA